MTADLDDPLLGRTLGGRFRVDRALKRGGMGAVYRGRDLKDDVDVAIKVVKQTLADDPEAIARFKREIRLMAEVQDPHIVRAVDAGDEAGVLWIAMELLDGPSLRERLDSRGRWPWADTLHVIRQIALALGAAHDKGVTHRDLKPENVMLLEGDGGPRVKLLDFGVARQSRAPDAAATHMTGTGLLVGTPGYIAPEVVLEGTVDDPRSDFYALGVTWFEMLTGQKPFSAKTPMALALRHAHEMPPTPSSLLPFAPVPGPVEQLVMRLLEKDPGARPSSATALVGAIDHLEHAAEQANTPVSTIKDLSPSESTVTSLETPGTHVAPLALATGASSSPTSASATSVTPAPSLVVTPPATGASRRLVASLGLVALLAVVALGAFINASARERRANRAGPPLGADILGTSNASAAPIVASVAQAPAQDEAAGDGEPTSAEQVRVAAPGGPSVDPVSTAEDPAAPVVEPPPTGSRVTRDGRVRLADRDRARPPVAPELRVCTVVDDTASGWLVLDGRRWRELSARARLASGTETLRFRRPGSTEEFTGTFTIPADGLCVLHWKGP